MAKKIAKHISLKIPRAEYAEILSDANVALVKAFDAFDPDRGVPFPAFAQTWIRGYILNGVRHRNPVSERNSIILRRSHEVWSQFAVEHGRPPTSAELEEKLPGTLRAMREAYERPAMPLEDALAEPLSEAFKPPDEAVVENERASELYALVNALSGRYRDIVLLVDFQQLTLSAVAALWHCSRQAVSKIHMHAFDLIRRGQVQRECFHCGIEAMTIYMEPVDGLEGAYECMNQSRCEARILAAS